MEQLAQMMTFAKVVETKSFSAAARALDTSKSHVSKQIASLESALGARLLNRTTRRMSVTEIGGAYYEHCARIAHEIDAARETASQLQAEPRGILKITAPVVFAALHLADALHAFLQTHPHVQIELNASDRLVDLVDEGYDLAIRISDNPALATVARKIANLRWATCASPDYLQRQGEPASPRDLVEHNCLPLHAAPELRSSAWRYRIDGKDVLIPVSGNCRANSSEVIHSLALAGSGIVLFPTYVVGADLQSGRLREILADYVAYSGAALYATYMPNRYMQPKVRAFIDHLVSYFGGEPRWDRRIVNTLGKRAPRGKR